MKVKSYSCMLSGPAERGHQLRVPAPAAGAVPRQEEGGRRGGDQPQPPRHQQPGHQPPELR